MHWIQFDVNYHHISQHTDSSTDMDFRIILGNFKNSTQKNYRLWTHKNIACTKAVKKQISQRSKNIYNVQIILSCEIPSFFLKGLFQNNYLGVLECTCK